MNRIQTATLALALLLPALGLNADAASSSNVTLTVDSGDSLVYQYETFSWTDDVALTPGMTALDLIDQVADARGASLTLVWYDIDGDGAVDDAYVSEINGVAEDWSLGFVGRYWALYVDGAYASAGVSGTVLEPGQTIGLVYEGFPLSF